MGTRQVDQITDSCRASLTGTSPTRRPHVIGRLGLVLAGVSILLGAVAGCGGSSPAQQGAGATSSEGGHPAAPQSSAAPTWGAPTHLDYSQGGFDPTSVSCPSASFCVAVLGSGYAVTYDGTTWSQPSGVSSSPSGLSSVSCPTASFCMAVDAGDSSTFMFNGSTWSSAPTIEDPVPNTDMGMASVSCPSPSFCAAIDNGSNAFTFNGTSWSPATTIDPGEELSTVSCPSASFCTAVDYGSNAVTFNGTSWSKPSAIDPGGYLLAVSCASVSFCVAVDHKGNAFTFNGSSWSAPVNADPDGLGLGSLGAGAPVVSCLTSKFCAVVDGGGGNVVTFDGSSWSAPDNIDSDASTSDSGPFLLSVSCPSAVFCVAGDSIGDAFVRS